MSTAVVWFRADLRLGDNSAWAAATTAHDPVVPRFVLDPRPVRVIPEVMAAIGTAVVPFNHDVASYAMRRDRTVAVTVPPPSGPPACGNDHPALCDFRNRLNATWPSISAVVARQVCGWW